MNKGTRVRLKCNLERYPHFAVCKGAEGVVDEEFSGQWWVKMIMPIRGCESWDNCVVFETREEMMEYMEVVR